MLVPDWFPKRGKEGGHLWGDKETPVPCNAVMGLPRPGRRKLTALPR